MTDNEKLLTLAGALGGSILGAALWEKFLLKLIREEESLESTENTIDYIVRGRIGLKLYEQQVKTLEAYSQSSISEIMGKMSPDSAGEESSDDIGAGAYL